MSEVPPVNHSWVDRNVGESLDGAFWGRHNKEVRKAEYYVRIAHVVASRSNCLVRRGFGAVIVKDDQIISTGYSGSARGTLNCGKDIPCIKNKRNLPSNTAYELCPGVHAEENAVIHAGRSRAMGATLYLSPGGDKTVGDRPCYKCRRTLLNAGIKDCWYLGPDGTLIYELAEEWIKLDNEIMMRDLNDE